MNYTIQLREDQKIVFATASGDWNSDTDNSMIRQIMEMVDATNTQKVLLDIRELHFKLPIARIFERAKEMGNQRREYGKNSAKAAIVNFSADPKIEEVMQFFENASRNRGLPYRTFTDIENAMSWLVEEGGSPAVS